ncbi:MAG: histidine kinase dimerization/phosphoacceptor domain -containing protein, partial [Bacteroidota bacterium]
EGRGAVNFYWFPHNIKIEDSKDIIDGVEHDLAESFVSFLAKKYQIQLELNWIETGSFEEVLTNVKKSKGGSFGASSISITEKRKTDLDFTPPYLPDIAVLISNAQIPLAKTPSEFQKYIDGGTAVTISSTTLSEALLRLEKDENLHFDIKYVQNSGQLIETIAATPRGFGYVDLSNFLVSNQQSSGIKRQLFFPFKLEGLAMAFPKDSDWQVPVEDYFQSAQFEKDRTRILESYLGSDVFETIKQISTSAEIGPFEEIALSYREKELAYEELIQAAVREQEQIKKYGILIALLGSSVILISFIGTLYFFKARTSKELSLKNDQISNALKERESLIREIHHRVKNNLQIISSLFSLQIRFINDASAKRALSDMHNRILAMSLVHENLYKTDSVTHVYSNEYFQNLALAIHEAFQSEDTQLETQIDQIKIPSETAVKIGLIVNELLTNSYKHAFPDQFVGEKKVSLHVEEVDGSLQIIAQDSGINFELGKQQTTSYGIQLIQSMVRSLKGKFKGPEIHQKAFTISIPSQNVQ